MLRSTSPATERVATRARLLADGVTPGQIRGRLSSGRWQVLLPGVYALFSGPVPPEAQALAAVLSGGVGAAAGPRTSLWLIGVLDDVPRSFDVVVPTERRVVRRPGLTIVRRSGLAELVHPVGAPPRMRTEAAVLDACDAATSAAAVVDIVLRAVQRRHTTVERLRTHLADRPRHRGRRLLVELLADVVTGVRSALELRWLRTVIRPHGLPTGALDTPDPDGPVLVHRDVWFEPWDLLVELDGRVAHPAEEAFRDRRRDNRAVISGRATLRYGWFEVAGEPCEVSAELNAALVRRGAPSGHGCTPGCPVGA